MQKTLFLLLCVTGVAGAMSAWAGNNVFISQVGANNRISVSQSDGVGNAAESYQQGVKNNTLDNFHAGNTPVIGKMKKMDVQTQSGNGNVANIRQVGDSNHVIQYQQGNDNVAILTQNAESGTNGNNRALQVQTGDENFSDIEQNGRNLYAESIQENAVQGSVVIRQNGVGTRLSVYQTGMNPPPVTILQQ